jgi:hypothetical protein
MKLLASIRIIMMVISGCGFFSMERYYQQSLPRTPDQTTGHVIPKNNHGVIVYYSQRELLVTNGLFFGGAAFGLIGGLLWRKQERRKES